MKKVILLTAQIWSSLSLGFMGLALIGQLFAPEPANFNSYYEVLFFSFFPVGVSIGMIISWWKSHLIGVIFTTVCLIVFQCMRPDIGLNIWIEGLSALGILFLIYGIIKAK